MSSKSLSSIAEIEVTYSTRTKSKDRVRISNSQEAHKFFRRIWSNQIELKEEFVMLLLNRANQVLGWYKLSSGGTAGTVVDPKIIFSVALKCLAHGIILCHNHPSGNLLPSDTDKALTEKLRIAGCYLDIAILDHLIITCEAYFSFADTIFI